MNSNDFITRTEGYYNSKYNKFQRKEVIDWLGSRKEIEIEFIYSEILKMLSPVYKTCPGIYELEKALIFIKKNRMSDIYPQTVPEYPDKNTKANKKVVDDLFSKLKDKIFVKPVNSADDIFK